MLVINFCCKEIGGNINFNNVNYSTYIENVESPQQKKILIDDFTGTACPNCPDAHAIISELITSYPEQVIAISEYNYSGDPLYIDQNLVTEDALDIDNYLGPTSSWPAVCLDRKDFNNDGSIIEYHENLPILILDQVGTTPPVNMYINTFYNSSSREVKVDITIKYTETITSNNHISIALTESGIIAAQIDDNVGGEVEDYIHNHVLRKMLTYYTGDALPEENVAGRVYEFEYTYTIPDTWNADNMNVVAFVHNYETDNKEVLQAVEGEVVE